MSDMPTPSPERLREIRNASGRQLLETFWGGTWPVGPDNAVAEEIQRRMQAYDRIEADIRQWLGPLVNLGPR